MDDESFDTSPWTGTNDYYGNWWGGNLRGVKDHPIDLGPYQKQLVYSPHDYGPMVFEQEWFKGDFPTCDDATAKKILYEQCWRDNWAYIIEDGIGPLLIGEWGGLTEGADKLLDANKKYLRSMRDYILENKYKLHHTFWCINIDSADTGGLFTRDEGTPFPGGRDLKWNDNKYDNYLYPVLWKNSEGKFIGLDHKIPLGKNGVSIGSPDDQPTIKYGDVNKDGEIDALDGIALKSYILGINQNIDTQAADLNKDNSIDALDMLILKRYILGQVTQLPVE
nr:cellulase family glycosylhydrolase [Ruminiclostridium josui]